MYSTPKRGGSFEVDPDMLGRHPILDEFQYQKMDAVQILSSLNEILLETNKKCVSPRMIQSELQKNWLSRNVFRQFNGINFLDFISSYNSFHKFSCVCYPVGEHVDHYDEGLENKTMAINRSIHHHVGRGGSISGNDYVFAILDWGREKMNRRFYVYHVNYLRNCDDLTHLNFGRNFRQTTLDEVFQIVPAFEIYYNEWMGNVGIL